MELILNLVWAGIAATLLVLWTAPKLAHMNARRSAVALLALLCVICILFPIVSMTDDLNASPAEPETAKLAVLPNILAANGPWLLVYDVHQFAVRDVLDAQPVYGPPFHSFLSFLLTRRPPPQRFA
ncbi:MAG TPA: hypothetical protein VH724_15080 [Candidatus Angelobacter sp.]|nr:hypothetical protein [Candidatus Angelobacter sp.]